MKKALFASLAMLATLGLAQSDPDARVKAALGQLDALARQTMERTHIPGMAIAVVYRDQVVYLKGFGVREVGKEAPVDPDTVFQLASMSKPLASTVVAALVGEGVVGWDDPVILHDPGFQLSEAEATREVTLRDLFSHHSGLPEVAPDLLEDLGFSRDEILYRLRYLPLPEGFRGQYAYSNYGITEGAVAAAKAAGVSWEELSAQKLYRPLGMKSTSSRLSDYLAASDRASLHVLEGGKYVARYQRDPDPQSPAGGVSSSVRDLAQWLRLQLAGGKLGGRQLIPTAALNETYVPEARRGAPGNPATDRTGFYGLGWDIDYDTAGRVRLGHSGAFMLGASTNVTMVPSAELGIVVLTNAAPVGASEAVAQTFMDTALDGQPQRDWATLYQQALAAMSAAVLASSDYSRPPQPVAPALPLSSYLGTYTSDFYGKAQIVERGGGLTLVIGPKQQQYPLTHYDRDVFTFAPRGESARTISGLTFQVGLNQQASSLNIESLDVAGQGTFTRVKGGTP